MFDHHLTTPIPFQSRNNLPPMFTNIVYTGCMLENTTSLTLVAPISATDPQGREVTYAIQSQQVTAFSINNATGKLSVLNASLVNYESYPPNPHIISVIVSNRLGLYWNVSCGGGCGVLITRGVG